MSSLPYIASPGTIEKALKAIQTAATPPTVSQDFVKTILGIKGGQGNQITSFLRKIGFTNTDGTPSELYKKFRNPATQGQAAAEAIRIGYKPLYARNEYMHALADDKLKGIIVEETGASSDASSVSQVLYCIKQMKKFASWEEAGARAATDVPMSNMTLSVRAEQSSSNEEPKHAESKQAPESKAGGLRMNLGYTINLNLPATSDPAVFNAIFRSLKDNLLRGSDD